MKKIRLRCYQFFGNSDIIAICRDKGISIEWILEAGCHDGKDTLDLLKSLRPQKYFAYEPDESARRKAIKLLEQNNEYHVKISPKGLSNTNSSKFLRYAAEGKGSGSTSIVNSGAEYVEVCRFDDEHQVNLTNGLLWLDVEGHTLFALEGMERNLRDIAIARIEVQLHSRRKGFVRDFIETNSLLKNAGLIPLYGPVYPGYFGDIIFVKKSILLRKEKLRSVILWYLMLLLHVIIYPATGKPSKNNI